MVFFIDQERNKAPRFGGFIFSVEYRKLYLVASFIFLFLSSKKIPSDAVMHDFTSANRRGRAKNHVESSLHPLPVKGACRFPSGGTIEIREAIN
ncbi:hypothetical protein NC651_002542 [Populus alba x Populus x berolinensis]|nr:hypothetical protein NC651_002542 [Populus alba x Populus x berolinensis]